MIHGNVMGHKGWQVDATGLVQDNCKQACGNGRAQEGELSKQCQWQVQQSTQGLQVAREARHAERGEAEQNCCTPTNEQEGVMKGQDVPEGMRGCGRPAIQVLQTTVASWWLR